MGSQRHTKLPPKMRNGDGTSRVAPDASSGVACEARNCVKIDGYRRIALAARAGWTRRPPLHDLATFSSIQIGTCIIHTCKQYPGTQLRSARCCSSRPQKEDGKCNLRNLKSRSCR